MFTPPEQSVALGFHLTPDQLDRVNDTEGLLAGAEIAILTGRPIALHQASIAGLPLTVLSVPDDCEPPHALSFGVAPSRELLDALDYADDGIAFHALSVQMEPVDE